MANISKAERERRLALSDEELAAEGLSRPKVRAATARGSVVDSGVATVASTETVAPKTTSKYKQAEKAVKKLQKIFARENAAMDRAISGVRSRFQIKKDVILDLLTPEVRALVDADLASGTTSGIDTDTDVENPDVSDDDDVDADDDTDTDLDVAANG